MMMEKSEIPQNYDIVSHLTERGMESITSKIFMDLDIKSLSSAEEASVVWASVIEEGKVWEKLYKETVLLSHYWKVIQNSLDLHMLGVLSNVEGDMIDQHEYKKACFLISKKLEEIQENWKSGTAVEKRCPIISPCQAYGEGFAWLFNTYRPTNNRSFALNSRWALTAGEDSKITIRNRFKLEEIVCKLNIPIKDFGHRPLISTVLANERFIVCCFYFHSEVCVWDVSTQKLLVVLDGGIFDENWDRLHSSLHKICLHEDSLLTMHGGGADVICTMYKFSTDPKTAPSISFQEMLSVKAVEAVYMDESLVCMHVCLNNLTFGSMELVDLNHRIYTRSASTFDAISDIDAKGVSDFHYQSGVIAIAEDSISGKKLRLLDAETEVCLKIVDIPQSYDTNLVDLKVIRNKYLVTCDDKGGLNVWDLERILSSDEKDGFLLVCNREPNLPLYRSWGVCGFEDTWIECDDFQVGLVGMFKPNEHSLFLRDFIGGWEFDEEQQ